MTRTLAGVWSESESSGSLAATPTNISIKTCDFTLCNWLLQQASVGGRFFFWGQDYGGGYAVAGFHVEEADALRVAADLADGFGIHANDFAVLADQHYLRVFVDQGDGYYFADTLGGLYVDYAFAAAVD
jgi:hypothetical protein